MRIFLVDDHQLFRSGLKLVLERAPGISVVAEAGDAPTALERCAGAAPDVLVIDIHLPGAIDGIELARRIRARCDEVKVIFLSSDGDFSLVRRAIAAGGNGYLLKNSAPQELLHAIAAVQAGGLFLCPDVASALTDDFRDRADVGLTPEPPVLSEREQEVLRLLVDGLRNKEIATQLGVSIKSVETYRTRLMAKLGYSSMAELVRFAVREGIITP
jgi:two-component system, NarL family, response regulator NreC